MDVLESLHIPRFAIRSDMLLLYIVPSLAVTSLVEFILIRNFSRMGVFLPQDSAIRATYDVLVAFGSLMFSLASLLAIAAFLTLSVVFTGSRRRLLVSSGRRAAFVFASLTLLSVIFLLMVPDALGSLIYVALSATAVLIVARSLPSNVTRTERWLVLLIAATFLTSYVFQAVPLVGEFSNIPQANAVALVVYNAGEFLALGAGVLLLFSYVRDHTSPKPIGEFLIVLAISAIFVMSYVRSAWLVSIVSMWTLGFTFSMPFPLYVLALAGLLLVVLNNLKRNPYLSYGLIFLLLSGRMMQLTYLNLLAILGFFLIVSYTRPSQGQVAAPLSL